MKANNNFKNLKEYETYLIDFLKDNLRQSSAKGFVLGLSGGIDSAVCAALALKASSNTHALWIDIESSKTDYEHYLLAAKSKKFKVKEINLKKTLLQMKKEFAKIDQKMLSKEVIGNLKSRLRMSTLYAYALANQLLVIGTGNANEIYSGYFTKYGDGASDLLLLSGLLKGQVKELAAALKVNSEIIARAPSAGLWENQTDEEQLGVSYSEFDQFLNKQKIDPSKTTVLEKLHELSAHKRNKVPRPKSFNPNLDKLIY